jgi:hypothetical protein
MVKICFSSPHPHLHPPSSRGRKFAGEGFDVSSAEREGEGDRSLPSRPGSVWVNGTLIDKILTIKKMKIIIKKFLKKLKGGKL